MDLVKWDPFKELRGFGTELGRFFRPFGDGWPTTEADGWTPRMDIKEDEKALSLKVEVPGVEKKDIDISIDKGVLTISGERSLEKEEKKEDFTRIERSYGSFSRSLMLPDYADEKNITAECKDGILRVMIPKVPGAKPEKKKIEVK